MANPMVTGVDPGSEVLCVLPKDVVEEDLALIVALSNASTLGEVRGHEGAWELVAYFPRYDPDTDEEVDFSALPDDTPFEAGEWFGEETFAQIPLARLRSAEHCPREVLERFGRPDDGVGFVDYERATWLAPAEREAIEQLLRELGYYVEQRDELIGQYLDI